MTLVKGFFRFWYDFIVGDSPVAVVGVIAMSLVGWLLVDNDWNGAAEIALPLMVVLTLVVSVMDRR